MKSKLKKILFIPIITILILEFFLFLLGFKPNVIYDVEIEDLKNLEIKTNLYKTDEVGIYSINSELVYSNTEIANIEGVQQILDEGLKQLTYIQQKSPIDDSLPEITKYLRKSNLEEDSILINYLKHPINKEGFRSIEFKKHEGTSKKRILLIGDSFTWGMSSNPIYKSFADNLLARGYLVYNTGIPGTDPAQYAAIAKKYIPILEPDLVIVNFYVGNDFMSYERVVEKDKPHEYYTNIGFVNAYPAGEFLKPNELFEYYSSIKKIPQTSLFNLFCSKTNVGTHILWRIGFELGFIKHEKLKAYLKTQNMGVLEKAKITQKYFQEIQLITAKNNVECLNITIPEVPFSLNKKAIIKNKGYKRKALNLVFENILYIHPKNIIINDYKNSDGHFNNNGHSKFTLFLEKKIQDLKL